MTNDEHFGKVSWVCSVLLLYHTLYKCKVKYGVSFTKTIWLLRAKGSKVCFWFSWFNHEFVFVSSFLNYCHHLKLQSTSIETARTEQPSLPSDNNCGPSATCILKVIGAPKSTLTNVPRSLKRATMSRSGGSKETDDHSKSLCPLFLDKEAKR